VLASPKNVQTPEKIFGALPFRIGGANG